jgi:hypothetical protein
LCQVHFYRMMFVDICDMTFPNLIYVLKNEMLPMNLIYFCHLQSNYHLNVGRIWERHWQTKPLMKMGESYCRL